MEEQGPSILNGIFKYVDISCNHYPYWPEVIGVLFINDEYLWVIMFTLSMDTIDVEGDGE